MTVSENILTVIKTDERERYEARGLIKDNKPSGNAITMSASTLMLTGVALCAGVYCAPDKGPPFGVSNLKSYYENLSSSHSQTTSSNKTHMITVYTTSRDTDTNGTVTHHRETTYVINNNGNVTTYTIREPDIPGASPPQRR